MRLACVASITLLCGCGQLADPDPDSGSDASIDVLDDVSDAVACTFVDAANCVSKLHYLVCGNGLCVTDEDICPWGDPDACVSVCETNEYGASCGGGPTKSDLPPSPDCRDVGATPFGNVFYCCPLCH